jgi:hypothetical protein
MDPGGAARVQEFHRQLFANSADEMRLEIERITGRQVREAAAEVETATGTVVHAFTTGAMVQVFLLTPELVGFAAATLMHRMAKITTFTLPFAPLGIQSPCVGGVAMPPTCPSGRAIFG